MSSAETYDQVNWPVTTISSEDLIAKEGYALVLEAGVPVLANNAASAAAARQLDPFGIVTRGVEAGKQNGVRFRGVQRIVAGTGGLAVGDDIVLEYNTGKFITASAAALVEGDVIWGRVVVAASADAMGEADIRPWRVRKGSPVRNGVVTSIVTAGAGTYTAAQLMAGGVINRDPTGASRTDTTATAAELVAAGLTAGRSVQLLIRNAADAAENITVAGGTGVTLRKAEGASDLVVGQNEVAILTLFCVVDTASSEAVTAVLAPAT